MRSPIAVSIPSEGRTLIGALNSGEPVIGRRRGRFAHGVWQLTAEVTGAPIRQLKRAHLASTAAGGAGTQAPAPPPRPGLFARLRGAGG